MEMHRTITCISCPRGCRIKVKTADGIPVEFEGHRCKRGLSYAEAELKDPKRILTTTIRVEGGTRPVLSVRTEDPIPKELLGRAMQELKGMAVKPPVKIGDTICENVAGTGVAVIATSDCPS